MRTADGTRRQRPWKARLVAGLVATVVGGTTPASAQEPTPGAASGVPVSNVAERTESGTSGGDAPLDSRERGIGWRPVLRESMLFLTAQHLTRFTEDRTVRELDGPFMRDWFRSVRSLD